ncbi:hypothetical protein QFC21_000276 [Naganishia friedmannii]|uniref:Uncharacterized protein n=1 Tax=Naganishia friedmannii TaxID=89922 RepID=A0ACC2WB21_9TREE|nr:hypothetical protein QFC21_000276 [Naganishia friedmannii]
MANNNAFANIDMAALLGSGFDLSMLNSLSGMNQSQQQQQQQQQQRPPMQMQGQGQGPMAPNMAGLQGMNMNMLANGGGGQPQNMGGNGMGNMQQLNGGMSNAQLLEAYNRLQASQMAQQTQNRTGTPVMNSNSQMPRMPSGQFPPAQLQQQQPQGDQRDHYQQLQRLLAQKNTAGALQNPMRPPLNQQPSNELLRDSRNMLPNGMNPNLAATQQQLRQAANQNINRVQQMQQNMQQQMQNLGQQQNSNLGGNQGNISNPAFHNGLFAGQNNQQNQFNMLNNAGAGQKTVPSPQMQNAQQQSIRPTLSMPQSSPLAPGRSQQSTIPQNLLELNNQFQQLNEQQRQQLMSLYQHQGRAQSAFSSQMTPRTIAQSLQSAGNPNSSPVSTIQPNQNVNMQMAQGQAMAAAQQRAHLAQQAQQAANQFVPNNQGGIGNQQQMPGAGNGQGPPPGQAGIYQPPRPNQPPPNGPSRAFNWEKISNDQLIETGKGMLPKLAAQIKALSNTPPTAPQRATMENQVRNNQQIRMTFVEEMKRRGLDMSLVGGSAMMLNLPPQQGQQVTPQTQNQSLTSSNVGMPILPTNVNGGMPTDVRQGTMNNNNPAQIPGGFPGGQPPRPAQNDATDSGLAANGLPRATTAVGRAIQEAGLVMPRQKFVEIVGSIYRNARKTEIPQHIIENRQLDLYLLFTTVCKFGGCAEVSSKDIWSMVGGLMGYVHNVGPPPISSAEVARQLQQVYAEALHILENHYLGVIQKQRKDNPTPSQNRLNLAPTGPSPAMTNPVPNTISEAQPQSAQANAAQMQPPAQAPNLTVIPPANIGGFTLDQLNKLATATSAQLKSYNMRPEQISIISNYRDQVLAGHQQKGINMRNQGPAPPVSSMGPNANGEWVVKGKVITPQEYERGKQVVTKMYTTHIASIPKLQAQKELNPEEIPEADRAQYQKQITASMQMLKSFDHFLTLEFAMRPQRQNESDVINLYKVAGLLRRAAGKWVTEHVAMLRPQVLASAFNKVAIETNKIRKSHLPDLSAAGVAQPPGASGQNPPPIQRANSTALSAAPTAEANGVIAPRLRVEDLKPPPAKRQRQSKDDKSSPASNTFRGLSVGTDGNPPTPTIPQTSSVPSPTTKKLPRPKPTRRKPSVATTTKTEMTPIIKPVEKLPTAPDVGLSTTPEVSLTLPQFTGLADKSLQSNSLGISFRQMGTAAVNARRKEEDEGRSDPLSFLACSMAKLENAMRSSGQTFATLENDLSLSYAPDRDDSRFDPSKSNQPQLQKRPHDQEVIFDYSSFIDESAFSLGDEEDSKNKFRDLQIPAKTPDLVSNPPGQIDPSPTSVVALTPHGITVTSSGFEDVYSPKLQANISGDGWLDSLGLDPSYWES